jgi:hypothetical protein
MCLDSSVACCWFAAAQQTEKWKMEIRAAKNFLARRLLEFRILEFAATLQRRFAMRLGGLKEKEGHGRKMK